MVNRSTQDPNTSSDGSGRRPFDGRDNGPLIRDDTSDAGSDLAGADSADLDDATDGQHTGDILSTVDEGDVQLSEDTGLDRVVGAEEAGLGGGLDQAEEAQLGITDEEIEELARSTRTDKH